MNIKILFEKLIKAGRNKGLKLEPKGFLFILHIIIKIFRV